MIGMELMSLPERQITGQVHQLDESIVDRLSHRSGKNGLSDQSKRSYKAAIKDFNRFLEDNGYHVSELTLKAYFQEIRSRYKASTLNQRKYALLKVIKAQLGNDSVFHQMAVDKVFESVPTYQTNKRISEDEVLTEDQIKEMMDAATDKTRLIINFLFSTGARVNEMIEIRLSDCERVSGGLVKIALFGKGRKVRQVFIRETLFEEIRDVYRGETWLFESKSHKKLNQKNIWTQLHKAGHRVGLSGVHPHAFRHSRATDMIVQKGVSVKAASQYLGHSSVSVTLDMYVKDAVNIQDLLTQDSI